MPLIYSRRQLALHPRLTEQCLRHLHIRHTPHIVDDGCTGTPGRYDRHTGADVDFGHYQVTSSTDTQRHAASSDNSILRECRRLQRQVRRCQDLLGQPVSQFVNRFGIALVTRSFPAPNLCILHHFDPSSGHLHRPPR